MPYLLFRIYIIFLNWTLQIERCVSCFLVYYKHLKLIGKFIYKRALTFTTKISPTIKVCIKRKQAFYIACLLLWVLDVEIEMEIKIIMNLETVNLMTLSKSLHAA